MKKILPIVLLVLNLGCAKISKSNLYWGKYSLTLYNYKKTPSKETLSEHIKEIQDILDYSKKHALKAPPGLQAELGLYKLREKKTVEARAFLAKEAESYPESIVLIKNLQSKIKGGEK